jgi:transcriptional regulator with XRE-family HTH domain
MKKRTFIVRMLSTHLVSPSLVYTFRCNTQKSCFYVALPITHNAVGAGLSGREVSAVDIHVGRRVRAGRLACGMSQESLAEIVGITFQQIQKYENGMNRIGTGRLYAISRALQLPVAYFFEGLDKEPSRSGGNSNIEMISEALATKEGIRIAIALSRIRNQAVRRRIADLLEAMITESEEPELLES